MEEKGCRPFDDSPRLAHYCSRLSGFCPLDCDVFYIQYLSSKRNEKSHGHTPYSKGGKDHVSGKNEPRKMSGCSNLRVFMPIAQPYRNKYVGTVSMLASHGISYLYSTHRHCHGYFLLFTLTALLTPNMSTALHLPFMAITCMP